MLDSLFNLFKLDNAADETAKVLSNIIVLLENFDADYLKDGNARDAAIDCVIQILQAHKTMAQK